MKKTTKKVKLRYLHSVGRASSVEKVDTKRCNVVVVGIEEENSTATAIIAASMDIRKPIAGY